MKALLLGCNLALALAGPGYALAPLAMHQEMQAAQSAPDAKIKAFVSALLHNRALELLTLSKPEIELRRGYASEQAAYARNLKGGKPPTNAEPEVQEIWLQLQTPAGRSKLEADWLATLDAKLPQFRAQWPMYLAMARASLAARTDLAPDTRASLGELLLALDKLVFEVDLADRSKLRASIADLAALVQSSSVANYYDLPALEFEAIFALAQRAMVTGKRIASRYGLEVNPALNSFDIVVTRASDDRAVLTMRGKVLGVPLVWREQLAWDGKTWGVASDRVYESTDDAPGRIEQFLH